MKKSTRVNHPPPVELPPDNRPLVAPIYQTVKFEFDTLEETERYLRGERPGFYYTRGSNPTTRQLEQLLAELQGRDDCLVTASGVAAISHALLALTKKGDHVLCFIETYNPSRYLIRRLLGRFGVAHTLLSIEDLPGIERTLTSQPTRLVYFESPTNPVTRIADIAAITRFARASGALTVMDNTFAGFHQHGGYGGERGADRRAPGGTSGRGARALSGPPRAPAARARCPADAGFRHHRHVRSQGRRRRGPALRGHAAAVRAHVEPRVHGVPHRHGADHGRARPYARATEDLRAYPGHHPPLDRARGPGGSHRGSRPRAHRRARLTRRDHVTPPGRGIPTSPSSRRESSPPRADRRRRARIEE